MCLTFCFVLIGLLMMKLSELRTSKATFFAEKKIKIPPLPVVVIINVIRNRAR